MEIKAFQDYYRSNAGRDEVCEGSDEAMEDEVFSAFLSVFHVP